MEKQGLPLREGSPDEAGVSEVLAGVSNISCGAGGLARGGSASAKGASHSLPGCTQCSRLGQINDEPQSVTQDGNVAVGLAAVVVRATCTALTTPAIGEKVGAQRKAYVSAENLPAALLGVAAYRAAVPTASNVTASLKAALRT